MEPRVARESRSAELEYGSFLEKSRASPGTSARIRLLEWHESVLKRFFTTMAAIAQGIANTVMKTYGDPAVELKPGDRAPDFALTGSDGGTYRLSDYAGRSAVILAWFPKAFTGG
jgi:hypothetical protein